MGQYVTGSVIRALREKRNYTQKQLAEAISVSDKTVSKWETDRGLPDVTLLEPLAKALKVSVAELLSGEYVVNRNRSGNPERARFYICPICGNVIWSMGEGAFSCCGVTLPPLEPEEPDGDWRLHVRCSKGTYVRTLCHDIGRALGCGGCMSSLRRTMAAGFTLAECRTIEEVQQQGESLLAATDSLFRQYPAYRIPSEQADRRCRCGNPLAAEGLQPGLYRVYGTDGTFLCLSRWENGVLTSEKNFFGA